MYYSDDLLSQDDIFIQPTNLSSSEQVVDSAPSHGVLGDPKFGGVNKATDRDPFIPFSNRSPRLFQVSIPFPPLLSHSNRSVFLDITSPLTHLQGDGFDPCLYPSLNF